MALTEHGLSATAVLFYLLTFVSALKTQVLSTVIYTRYGDRTPIINKNPTLTPLGAQQLYQAGSRVRNRYIDDSGLHLITQPSEKIRFISPTTLINTQLSILSTTDQWISASAQAFLQGLYPPFLSGSNVTAYDGMQTLANGSLVGAPLNGIQYPNIRTASTSDYRSTFINGMTNCPAYTEAMMDYYNTTQYESLLHSSQPFYQSLQTNFLDYAFDNSSATFSEAYYIWDYLNYLSIHEQTMAGSSSEAHPLSQSDLDTARVYASDWVFAMYANTSSDGKIASDHIRAIAGRTLAYRVLHLFSNSIHSAGDTNMMNLMFGSFEPMVSLAALAGLTTTNTSAFYNIPEAGSSFVFELFSMLPENASDDYPSTSDMYVRFLYYNGTDEYSTLREYPMFGNSPSQAVMSLSDFANSMQRIMVDDEDWCTTCGSDSDFCAAYTESSTGSSTGKSTHKNGISPAIGGVIGALVTLVCALLLVGAFMLFGGLRLHRVERKRKSQLSGFKGAEKLRSDQDLTLPKGGAGAVVTETSPDHHNGHERVGSWELREQAKDIESQAPGLSMKSDVGRRPSFEDDEININAFATPVKPKDQF